MKALRVLHAGVRASVEDLGRAGWAASGVPEGGAFDPLALAAANRRVGNHAADAGLEILLAGPELEALGDEPIALALAGALAPAARRVGTVGTGAIGTPVDLGGAPIALAPGERLAIGPLAGGARAWLAVAGGIAAPSVLGSRSTCVAAGFGGIDGRPLRAGDLLPVGTTAAARAAIAPAPPSGRPGEGFAAPGEPRRLRVTPGPEIDLWPADPLRLLAAALWIVGGDSDRTGVRLVARDPAIAARLGGVAGIAPSGNPLGTLQVPPDGSAIALGPDRPVTGGYARAAIVAEADIGVLAGLRPGDAVRFEPVSLDEARRARAARRVALDGAAGGER